MSAELETSLLRALVAQPALLESCDLRDSDFLDGQLRKTFSGIAALWEETRAGEIDPVILAQRIGGSGAFSFVSGLMDSHISLDLKLFPDRILELRRLALTARIRTKLRLQESMPELDLNDIRPDLDALDRLRGGTVRAADFLKTGAELQALDIRTEYTINKILPSRSLTILPARGGIGKTYLCLSAAGAVNSGTPFLGLETKKRPVYYIDFENPLPVLVERVRKLNIRDVIFYHLSAPTPPPKLDSPNWTIYKKILVPGSLVIFDTLRASYDGKENDSDVAALVMGRLKELRELNLDIIALHHTSKADDRRSKGSTAWTDLADHVLDFHRHRRYDLKEIDDDDPGDQDTLFSLGTGEKTRFAPFRVFLTFDPETGAFRPAEDPKGEQMDQLALYIAAEGLGKNQTELVAWAKEELGIKKRDTTLALLKRGEGNRWRTSRSFKGAKIYEPI